MTEHFKHPPPTGVSKEEPVKAKARAGNNQNSKLSDLPFWIWMFVYRENAPQKNRT